MGTNKNRDSDGVKMLAVDGQVQLLEPFFERLTQTIRNCLREEIREALTTEMEAPSSRRGSQAGHEDPGLHLEPGERAAAARSRNIDPFNLGLEAGQGMVGFRYRFKTEPSLRKIVDDEMQMVGRVKAIMKCGLASSFTCEALESGIGFSRR